jgi:hypothetical protein
MRALKARFTSSPFVLVPNHHYEAGPWPEAGNQPEIFPIIASKGVGNDKR